MDEPRYATIHHDPLEHQPAAQRPGFKFGAGRVGLLVILAAVVAGSAFGLSNRSGTAPVDSGAAIAQVAGAASCSASRFWIVKADRSKLPIWNCEMVTGVRKCVTYENGIASDSTVLVRALFATSLSGRPVCLP